MKEFIKLCIDKEIKWCSGYCMGYSVKAREGRLSQAFLVADKNIATKLMLKETSSLTFLALSPAFAARARCVSLIPSAFGTIYNNWRTSFRH